MPEFHLDTAGVVNGAPHVIMPDGQKLLAVGWAALDAFTQGYIEALFFTENEPGTDRSERDDPEWAHRVEEGQQKDIPGDYGFSDLAPEALETILADCAAFQESYGPMWADGGASDEQAGHDFWLTRNRHGAGFWDRPDDFYGEHAETLTDAAHAYGEVDAYVGDDGKVYLS